MLRLGRVYAGVDCEEVSRFEGMDSGLIRKLFTESEIRHCRGKARPCMHFAARFAGKEAVAKCFGGAGKAVTLDRIEILNRKNGSPYVRLLGNGMEGYGISISLSHTKGMAIAFAVMQRSGR